MSKNAMLARQEFKLRQVPKPVDLEHSKDKDFQQHSHPHVQENKEFQQNSRLNTPSIGTQLEENKIKDSTRKKQNSNRTLFGTSKRF